MDQIWEKRNQRDRYLKIEIGAMAQAQALYWPFMSIMNTFAYLVQTVKSALKMAQPMLCMTQCRLTSPD